jgi:hypothetical protein
MMRTLPAFFLAAGLLLGMPCFAAESHEPLAGDFPAESFPENWEARRELKDRLVMAPSGRVLAWKGSVSVSPLMRTRVRVVSQGDSFYILFENERGGAFTTYSQGSWVFKRSKADGSFVQAKVFLKSDPGVFARIYPFKDRAKLEIILYGAVAYRDILLPQRFEDIVGMPFSKIIEQSSASVDWSLLSPNLNLYASQRSMVAAVREGIKGLEYGFDGAIGRDGRAVTIADLKPQAGPTVLNCSGFAKWIADGLYSGGSEAEGEPSLMPVDALKRRLTEVRGTAFSEVYEDLRDPYFGLDWIRNIGMLLSDKLSPGRAHGPLEQDVSIHPFSLITGVGEILNTRLPYEQYPDYTVNVGYQVKGLRALFYKLAISEPGDFYLGAFSSDKGGDPALTQYYHIAAFFPYFDKDGVFKVAVFESCAETSLDKVMARVPNEYIALVRLRSDSRVDYKAATGIPYRAQAEPSPDPDQVP